MKKKLTLRQRAAATLAATALLLGAGTAAASAVTYSEPYKAVPITGTSYWCPTYVYAWYTPEEKAAGWVDGWVFNSWVPCK